MDKTTVTKFLWRTTCQVRLFNDNSNIRFFAVDENNRGNEDGNESMNYWGALIKDVIGEAEDRDKSHQATLNQVRDSQSLVTKTPWLRHTRWEEIFIGKDMSELVKLSNAPGMQDHHEINVTDETNNNSKIEKKILEQYILLIQHSDYAKERSSLVYFMGVLGYNVEWKQWRQPLEYMTILAGIQFCMRVIMLEAALLRIARDGINETSPENPVELFRKVRDKWLIDGEGIRLLAKSL